MPNTVRLLANAGVLIEMNGVKILLDALHRRKTERFSRVSEALLFDIVQGNGTFQSIDFALVTHDHRDHHDEDTARVFVEHHPDTVILTPTALHGRNVYNLESEADSFQFEKAAINCRRIAHEGKEYASVRNYGYLVEVGGTNFIAVGDGLSDFENIGKLAGNTPIDTAFLPFPFVTLMRGREFLGDVLKPRNIVAFHLPFPEDDISNYTETTKYITKREKEKLPPTILLYKQGQEESF